MNITPDWIVLAEIGPFTLSATIVFTWLVMFVLVLASWLATRRLRTFVDKDTPLPPLQNFLESAVGFLHEQLRQVLKREPDRFLPFLGTLGLFIAVCNLLTMVPGYQAPTASLSTTTALALLVFLAVPWWGVQHAGLWRYLKNYGQPTFMMLPFNIIGELSRTLALAVRLFGNLMSGQTITAILLLIAPLVVPVLMSLLGLLTGAVQAYIFFILAAVYVAAGMETQDEQQRQQTGG
jgi:F-type H+-transporting ATPase subunit a